MSVHVGVCACVLTALHTCAAPRVPPQGLLDALDDSAGAVDAPTQALRGFAYQALGDLAARVPSLVAGRVDLAQRFFAGRWVIGGSWHAPAPVHPHLVQAACGTGFHPSIHPAAACLTGMDERPLSGAAQGFPPAALSCDVLCGGQPLYAL